MKRIFTILFAAMFAGQAWATDNFDFSAVCSSGQTLYYSIRSAEPYTVAVTYPKEVDYNYYAGYTEPKGNLVIPEEIEYNGVKYSVRTIDDCAFRFCSGLTSVTIPNSVTYIFSSAFSRCSGLTTVTIGNSVTYIGNSAFEDCSGLTTVTIPNSVTSIDRYAFWDCSGLTSVTIGNSVTRIGYAAFCDCSGLTSVTIPNSVTSIDHTAFSGCSKLTEINVDSANTKYTSENGVLFNKDKTTIVRYPANKTETTYTIPNSVTSIGYAAFYKCSSLTSVTIPNSATSIGSSAFEGCSGLTSIKIPNSVTSIGYMAFYSCTNSTIFCEAESKPKGWSNGWNDFGGDVIWNVQISENKDFEFNYDSTDMVVTLVKYKGSADTVSVPSGVLVNDTYIYTVSQIGDEAFNGCASVKSIKLPSSIKSYGKMAFKNCTALKILFVPQSVTSIGEDAFYGCTTATIACEAESKPIGWNSNWNNNGGQVVWKAQYGESKDFEFEYDTTQDGNFIARLVKYKGNSESVSVPPLIITDSAEYTVIYVNKEAFCENKRIKTVKLPTTLRGLGDRVFKNCTALESIIIPDSVDRINESMFYGCSSLKSVGFGQLMEYIMNGAFEKSGLEFVALPKTVTSIYDFAFADCENLKQVYIPETVVKNEYHAFVDCTNATIYCAAAKQPETWKELWNEDGGTVVWGHSVPADSTFDLKFATKSDGTAAVASCPSEVSSIDIPTMVMIDSSVYFVTGIEGGAFADCQNLNNINIEGNNPVLTLIDGVLFDKMNAALLACLTVKTGTYTIPDWVTSIYSKAFMNCSNLQTVQIPKSVTEIDAYAFDGCDNLTIYCNVSSKPLGWNDGWNPDNCQVIWGRFTPVIESAATAVNIYAYGNTIVVENATDEIFVYNAMGVLVCRDDACRVRQITVNTPGVYIVKTGGTVKRVVVN